MCEPRPGCRRCEEPCEPPLGPLGRPLPAVSVRGRQEPGRNRQFRRKREHNLGLEPQPEENIRVRLFALFGPLPPAIAALEVKVMGSRIDHTRFSGSRRIVRRQFGADLAGYRPSHIIFQSEDVAQVALEALSPQMPFLIGVNQLRGDPYSLPRPEYRAFNDRVRAEPRAQFPQPPSWYLYSARQSRWRSPEPGKSYPNRWSVHPSFRRRSIPPPGRPRD